MYFFIILQWNTDVTNPFSQYFSKPLPTLDDFNTLDQQESNSSIYSDFSSTGTEPPPEDDTLRRTLIHINVEYNPTPFGIIPVFLYNNRYVKQKIHLNMFVNI